MGYNTKSDFLTNVSPVKLSKHVTKSSDDANKPFGLLDGIKASDLEWKVCQFPKLKELPQIYLQISKARLTALVVITAMAGYGLAPGDFALQPFIYTSIGTALTSAAA